MSKPAWKACSRWIVLIVGDVGYGKTEVAMRAAFKVVMEGKPDGRFWHRRPFWVFQHFKTFSETLRRFPHAHRDGLSRFRSTKQQKRDSQSVGGRRRARHRHRHAPFAVEKTFASKTSACLIVDEEQRFGVAHKERIKQMRKKRLT